MRLKVPRWWGSSVQHEVYSEGTDSRPLSTTSVRFFWLKDFYFMAKPSPDTDRRVMSCVSHAVGLTSVKATAQWDELQRGLEAVLRVLVSSEYLNLVVFCGQF